MGKYKVKSFNKGWVSIYTLVICGVVTTMILYIAHGTERKVTYVDNYISTIEKEDLRQKKKEYLMTEFNMYVDKNLNEIKKIGIHEYFLKNNITNYLNGIERDGLKFDSINNIKYDLERELFEVNVGNYIYRFRFSIEENGVKYKFIVIT